MKKMPKNCTHPDCFTCPYPDCIFEQMTIEEYMESKNRDKEYAEPKDLEDYQQRSFDCSDRKEYWRNYYRKNREHHLMVSREYRQRTNYKSKKDRREYYKRYFQEHKEEKYAKQKERNRKMREDLNATG